MQATKPDWTNPQVSIDIGGTQLKIGVRLAKNSPILADLEFQEHTKGYLQSKLFFFKMRNSGLG